ncbi:MAG: metallophosphoesterase [Sandaracinaceae bacterium]|jgi:predicted MPP superfamily phosphohydrolase|nr:metallophosphoesterase [Sandaracinaceae bacterium]
MSNFSLASVGAWLAVALAAYFVRGRPYAMFVSIIVGVYTFSATSFAPIVADTLVWPAFATLHVSVYVHLLLLARPRMRPLWYRVFVSIPASFFVAGAVLSLPWGILIRLGFHPWVPWLPFAVALTGVWHSMTARKSNVHIVLDELNIPTMARHRSSKEHTDRPLKIVQITDPHLGPFMSVARLRKICERAVLAGPDLIVLTGDFLTMESQDRADHLRDALAPLLPMAGRTFACHGNHDHEAPRVVAEALSSNGIHLLIDEQAVARTPYGDVEVLGFDFVFANRKEHAARLAAKYPRTGLMRIALLHDPGAFKHLPEGTADLVLSGHTHGGHLGFVSLGGTWTVPRIVDMPDHGLWARNRDRLYVHRGTGHYGFPLRLGVPAEESVLHVHSKRS